MDKPKQQENTVKTQNLTISSKNPSNTFKLAHVAVLLGIALLSMASSQPAVAGPRPLPGNSSAFGQTMPEWQELYWRRYYGGISLPSDGNRNSVVGHVVFMPTWTITVHLGK